MKEKKNSYPLLRPLWPAIFVDILGFTVILPFLPFFIQEFNSSPLMIGLLLSSNAIFSFFFGPILGKLSDKYGRKPLLLISQAGTVVGFIVLTFSSSLEMLFLARIIDGIFGGQFPISKAAIGDVVSPKDRAKQMTNIGVAFTLAALIGPAMGGFLSPYGIIAPGLLSTGLSLFTLIFTAIYFKETLNKQENQKFNSSIQTSSLQNSESVLKNSRVMYLLILYGFLALVATTFQTSLSIFASYRIGLIEQDIGILYTLMGVFQVFNRIFIFNRMRKWLGDTKTSIIGLGSYIFSFTFLAFVSNFWTLVLALIFISFSGSISRGIIIGFTSRAANSKIQGKVMGLNSSLDNLSQIIGPIIGGALLSSSSKILFSIVLAAIALITFLLSFRLLSFQFEQEDKTQMILSNEGDNLEYNNAKEDEKKEILKTLPSLEEKKIKESLKIETN